MMKPKDVSIGQLASIDTRNGIIPGQVIRIDPAAVNGSVKVDVHLNGELPKGARPDLSVDKLIITNRVCFKAIQVLRITSGWQCQFAAEDKLQ